MVEFVGRRVAAVSGNLGTRRWRRCASARDRIQRPFQLQWIFYDRRWRLDYAFRRRFSIRMQADYIGTRINGTFQNSVSAGAGFVVNF